jgi:excisionase family DNA binding protein
MMDKPLLNSKQVADRLGMSKVWVYKAAESGLLPFYRVGDALRFNEEEIKAYLESRKGLKRGNHLDGKQEGVGKR